MTIPRLTPRFGNAAVLATGLAVTLAGMAWLSRVGVDSSYLTAVALPMFLVGTGQGLAFAPLTSAGIAGVTAREAGAASGLVNTAHQLGSALGLAILVALSASSGAGAPNPATALADHTSAAMTGGSVMPQSPSSSRWS
jgi:sugar phosphate permease